ncbi:type IV pilus assembly protein PilM [Cryobacterium luteum]|uniref:Type IV pilus assembly protein PilM n=1 Tax=Cryobacterium luteum TaxID=1424661 RepID=A0A1H8C1H9_9MICO|nr:type IV pilus assembly protein PilM [Cryobacterium luteum]TFB89215.1 type IV pilus assembly protein PilM [Cryobacterium luteum]SEM88975.1 type IV pilus assembly protein PilM [Cryobacterium luteum]
MAQNVVGIDIGTAHLRAVEVRNPGKTRPTVLRYHEVPLPTGAVSGGEVLEPHTVAAALKALWSGGGFRSRQVVLGMGSQRVLARDLSVPKMSLARIRQSLPFEVQDLLPVPVADALLDFYPISESTTEHGPTVNGLLIAAVKAAVVANVSAARLAGLTTIDVDLIPFAVSRLLVTRPGMDGVVAVIDLGATTTSVVITRQGVPQFVRIIPTGGDDVTRALAAGLKTDAATADLLKRRVGLLAATNAAPRQEVSFDGVIAGGSGPIDAAGAHIIAEVMNDQLGSVVNTLSYYASTRPSDPVTAIVLSGGGARLPGLPEAVSKLTRLGVSTGDPLSTVGLASALDAEGLRLSSAAYTVALGLALGRAA